MGVLDWTDHLRCLSSFCTIKKNLDLTSWVTALTHLPLIYLVLNCFNIIIWCHPSVGFPREASIHLKCRRQITIIKHQEFCQTTISLAKLQYVENVLLVYVVPLSEEDINKTNTVTKNVSSSGSYWEMYKCEKAKSMGKLAGGRKWWSHDCGILQPHGIHPVTATKTATTVIINWCSHMMSCVVKVVSLNYMQHINVLKFLCARHILLGRCYRLEATIEKASPG